MRCSLSDCVVRSEQVSTFLSSNRLRKIFPRRTHQGKYNCIFTPTSKARHLVIHYTHEHDTYTKFKIISVHPIPIAMNDQPSLCLLVQRRFVRPLPERNRRSRGGVSLCGRPRLLLVCLLRSLLLSYFTLFQAAGAIFLAREVHFREGPRRRPRTLVLDTGLRAASLQAEKTHFAPVFAPAVATDPVLAHLLVDAPPDNGNHVVDGPGAVRNIEHAIVIVAEVIGVDSACKRALQQFLLHVLDSRDHAVLRDRRIREMREAHARAAHLRES
mmetsp:Transcript_7280/g.17631  ORF Transcript_7280/g.17631 Transcript_7280/m.17631 type:complete len:271 (-) Transcript_7280:906-1718(-)